MSLGRVEVDQARFAQLARNVFAEDSQLRSIAVAPAMVETRQAVAVADRKRLEARARPYGPNAEPECARHP